MKEEVRFFGLDVHAEPIAVAVARRRGEVCSLGTIAHRAESTHRRGGGLELPAAPRRWAGARKTPAAGGRRDRRIAWKARIRLSKHYAGCRRQEKTNPRSFPRRDMNGWASSGPSGSRPRRRICNRWRPDGSQTAKTTVTARTLQTIKKARTNPSMNCVNQFEHRATDAQRLTQSLQICSGGIFSLQ